MTRKRKKDTQQDTTATGSTPDIERIWRDWDAYDAAAQERLKRGFIEPFNPVKETQDAKPVKETKRRKKQSDE